jgi:hypothetical protein
MPEGQALTSVFDDLCDGAVTERDFAKHLDATLGSEGVLASIESGLGGPLSAEETVFLLIKNECASTAAITISHEIKLLHTVPLRVAQAAVKVRSAPMMVGWF